MNLVFSQQINSERNIFKNDVLDLFRGRKYGHMGHWEYSDSLFQGDTVRGTQEWIKFLANNPEYYVIAREINLAAHFHLVASHYGEFETIVDLGPGSEFAVANKSFAVINQLPKVKNYVPIDLSGDYLVASKKYAEKRGLRCFPVEADFFSENPAYQSNQNKIFMMWGGTHSNIHGDPRNGIPYHEMVKQLKAIRSMMGKHDRFIVSQDTNQKISEIEAAYSGQSDFARTILHRVQRDLSPRDNFNVSAFDFGVVWHSSSCSLAHYFMVMDDMEFSIDNEDVSLRKGQRLYFNNSYKFPELGFSAMYEAAGFRAITKPLYDDTKTIALHQLMPS